MQGSFKFDFFKSILTGTFDLSKQAATAAAAAATAASYFFFALCACLDKPTPPQGCLVKLELF